MKKYILTFFALLFVITILVMVKNAKASPTSLAGYTDTIDGHSQLNIGNINPRGETFIPSISAHVTSLDFTLARVGSPTGNLAGRIYATTGTCGSGALPTGAALATSDVIDVSTLSTSDTLVTFTFSGTQPTVVAGTCYAAAFVQLTGTGNASNNVLVAGQYTTPGYASGQPWYFFISSFNLEPVGGNTADFLFDVFGEPLPPSSNANPFNTVIFE